MALCIGRLAARSCPSVCVPIYIPVAISISIGAPIAVLATLPATVAAAIIAAAVAALGVYGGRFKPPDATESRLIGSALMATAETAPSIILEMRFIVSSG